MKCAICGIQIDSVEDGIDQGWIPYVWEGEEEKAGPFCPSCSEVLIQVDEDGEYVVKEEYLGKIAFQEGDLFDDELQEDMASAFMLACSDN